MIPLTGWIAARLGRKRYAGRLDHDELELVCAVVHAARTASGTSAVSMEYHPEATAPVSSGGLISSKNSLEVMPVNTSNGVVGTIQVLRGRPRRPRVLGAGWSSCSSGSTSKADSEETTVRSSGASRSRSSESTSFMSGGGVH